MYDYDVIFIGAGHASWHAAMILLQAGKKMAFVERDVVGGTCTNYGCNAKILLDTPFNYLDGLKRYQGIGISDLPKPDWTSLMNYKKKVISPLNKIMEGMFENAHMPVIHGNGKLVDAHTVDVDGRKITAENIVIGTGEHAMKQDIPGKEYIHDSRDFLDLDSFPARIAFIGGGIIAMEFASIAVQMGAQTTVIEYTDRVLRMYPEKYVGRVVDKMKAAGASFLLNHEVKEISKKGSSYVLTFADGSTLETDYVLEATGRAANTENLGLEDLGISYSRRGIQVDDHMRTSVPNIYASGDCVDKRIPKLTPTATFESNYIATQILGINPNPIQYPVIPNLVFTLPRISQVGVTLEQAEAQPDVYDIEVAEFGKRLLFEAKNQPDAEFTFIFNKKRELVGGAFYGEDAGTNADIAALIINQKLTGMQLNQMIFTFPTESQALLNLLTPLMLKKV
ncbi:MULTISPECIES: dihydrolipoyl dehydrogenase family protein [unclassified Bilifractor]|uniref:dihydrolipoyl dehydrogenase family protein n=1 Tax=unclassified Bilifractor TaxID=2815795 RepID=UPI003F9375F1